MLATIMLSGGPRATSELLTGGSAELLQRLSELKSLYRSHKEQLGDTISVLRARGAVGLQLAQGLVKRESEESGGLGGAGGGATSHHTRSQRAEQDESSSSEAERKAKRTAAAAKRYFVDTLDPTQLQAVIRQVILEHGGAAHLDTIVEYIRMRWPGLRRRDGSHYSAGDFRKMVLNSLRANRNVAFTPDRYHENCFNLAGTRDTPAESPSSPLGDEAVELEDEAADPHDTLANVVVRFLEARGALWAALPGAPLSPLPAPVTGEEVVAQVQSTWRGKPALEADELQEAVRVTLATNPRVKKDPRRADAYLAAPRRPHKPPPGPGPDGAAPARDSKRRRARADAEAAREELLAADEAADGAGSAAENAAGAAPGASDEDEAPRGRTSRRGARESGKSSGGASGVRSTSPPPGYSCRCGATAPGKGPTCKWRKGPSGEWLCNSCGLSWAKRREPPLLAGPGAPAGAALGSGGPGVRDTRNGAEKEREREKEVNPWIQCDSCHRWVQAKSDNIEDISLYDDANPEHLDYYCPRCRKRRADALGGAGAGDDLSESMVITPGAAPPAKPGTRAAKAKRAARGRDNGAEADTPPPPELDQAADAASSSLATRRSSRAKGGRKRLHGEEEEESKLDATERALLEQWEEERAARAASLQQQHREGEAGAERLAAVQLLERKFEEEAARFKATLAGHRAAAWEKNAREALEGGAREVLDERADEDLAAQFRDWFERRRAKLRQHIDDTLAPDA